MNWQTWHVLHYTDFSCNWLFKQILLLTDKMLHHGTWKTALLHVVWLFSVTLTATVKVKSLVFDIQEFFAEVLRCTLDHSCQYAVFPADGFVLLQAPIVFWCQRSTVAFPVASGREQGRRGRGTLTESTTGWPLTWKTWKSQGIPKWSGKMEKVREKSGEVKSGVFSQALNTPKLVFQPGLCPGPRSGSLRCSPILLGRGTSHPLPPAVTTPTVK